MARPKRIGAQVRALLHEDLSNREIRERLGVCKATVSHHAKVLGVSAGPGWPARNWAPIAAAILAGASAADCFERFLVDQGSFYSAVKKGAIPKPTATRRKPRMTAFEMGRRFIGKQGWSYRSRIKKAMLDEGIISYACAECGISEWRGKRLDLRLDHIDGVSTNFDIANLRLLCPNCDSQQDTYCHKNARFIPAPSKAPEIGVFTCPQCAAEFERSMRRVRDNQGAASKAGPFCSRRCAGRYSQKRQYAKALVLVAESVDAVGSNPAAFGRAGSWPAGDTNLAGVAK